MPWRRRRYRCVAPNSSIHGCSSTGTPWEVSCPPSQSYCSTRTTFLPTSSAANAAATPPSPPPTTRMSASSFLLIGLLPSLLQRTRTELADACRAPSALRLAPRGAAVPHNPFALVGCGIRSTGARRLVPSSAAQALLVTGPLARVALVLLRRRGCCLDGSLGRGELHWHRCARTHLRLRTRLRRRC